MFYGVLVALFSAFTASLREASRKHVSSDFNSAEIGYITQVYGCVLLLPFTVWFYLQEGVVWSWRLLAAIIISGGVVASSTYIYIEAMRLEDFSLTEPLRQTTPIFVAVMEPLILGAVFGWTIAAGALLGSVGAYLIVSKNGLAKPLKNIANKGALMSVVVAFIFAVWAIVSRFGATNMHPVLFTYATYVAGLVMFGFWKRRAGFSIETQDYLRKDIFSVGSVTALGAVVGIYAYSLLSASEATIIKQTSGIFSVLIGGRVFQEESIIRKSVGALIIILAVILVVI